MGQPRIFVIGAGAWGTALAALWSGAGKDVTLCGRDPAQMADMQALRENQRYLPGIKLPETLHLTHELAEADLYVLAVPAQGLRATLTGHVFPAAVPMLLCSKGIELESGKLMCEVAEEVNPKTPIAVLSGPNFAGEVARGLPTASVIATADEELRNELIYSLNVASFRLYYTSDMIGAEIAGALKNVLAIACGVAQGMGLGENARAALITRGLAEITRLALACGASMETLAGLSGLGDVVLSCSSPTSRNMSFGIELGKGEDAAEVLAKRGSVVEGAPTAKAVLALAARYDVELPICATVAKVIDGSCSLTYAVQSLLDRPLKAE